MSIYDLIGLMYIGWVVRSMYNGLGFFLRYMLMMLM